MKILRRALNGLNFEAAVLILGGFFLTLPFPYCTYGTGVRSFTPSSCFCPTNHFSVNWCNGFDVKHGVHDC